MSERPIGHSVPLPDVGSVHDLRSLNRLRELGRQDEQAALKAAAKQFESVFLQQLMKSMRDANEVFEDEDFFGGGDTSDFYQQMHDEQMALSLANSQSLGLADVMVQQLSRAADRDAGSKASTEAPANQLNRSLPTTMPVRQSAPISTLPISTQSISTPPVPTPQPPLQSAQNVAPPSPLAFVQSVLPHAEQVAKTLGVDPALLVAQAALETGWGKSISATVLPVAGKDLPVTATTSDALPMQTSSTTSHQYFGIKADSRWQGKTVSSSTLEYQGGVPQRQRASFRAYDSVSAAFADYAQFIQSSPRYAEALKRAADPSQYAHALQQGGYATDPAYAEKLLRVFNSENLRDLLAEARKLL